MIRVRFWEWDQNSTTMVLTYTLTNEKNVKDKNTNFNAWHLRSGELKINAQSRCTLVFSSDLQSCPWDSAELGVISIVIRL